MVQINSINQSLWRDTAILLALTFDYFSKSTFEHLKRHAALILMLIIFFNSLGILIHFMIIVLDWIKVPKFFGCLVKHLHSLCRLEKHENYVAGDEHVAVLVEELPHVAVLAAAEELLVFVESCVADECQPHKTDASLHLPAHKLLLLLLEH